MLEGPARRVAPGGGEVSVVVPTVGRESLAALLQSISRARHDLGFEVIVVDDRPLPVSGPLSLAGLPHLDTHVDRVLSSFGQGPAAARNRGWRASSRKFIAFVDDDVVCPADWGEQLLSDLSDLSDLGSLAAASQGRISVPLPGDRRPTDWERNVAGLERAVWATADCAYARSVLEEVGGFDERFRRAFREDSDLGLRTERAGYFIVRGERSVRHPVRSASPLVSLTTQANNADDALMRALHGPCWRLECHAEPGRNAAHLVAVGSGLGALLLAAGEARSALSATGKPARRRRRLLGAGLFAALHVEEIARFSLKRIAPGPRTAKDVGAMVLSSALIPWLALYHRLRGTLCLPSLLSDRDRAPLGRPEPKVPRGARQRPPLPAVRRRPEAVLFDRDGTLVYDVAYNADPTKVRAVPGARLALSRLRQAGLRVGIVSNQSGVARGLISEASLRDVNARVEQLLGPFDAMVTCPHAEGAGCACRKPRPGLVFEAAAALGVDPSACVVVGDTEADVAAGAAAGGFGILVPNRATRRRAVKACEAVAPDLLAAVDLILGCSARAAGEGERPAEAA